MQSSSGAATQQTKTNSKTVSPAPAPFDRRAHRRTSAARSARCQTNPLCKVGAMPTKSLPASSGAVVPCEPRLPLLTSSPQSLRTSPPPAPAICTAGGLVIVPAALLDDELGHSTESRGDRPSHLRLVASAERVRSDVRDAGGMPDDVRPNVSLSQRQRQLSGNHC